MHRSNSNDLTTTSNTLKTMNQRYRKKTSFSQNTLPNTKLCTIIGSEDDNETTTKKKRKRKIHKIPNKVHNEERFSLEQRNSLRTSASIASHLYPKFNFFVPKKTFRSNFHLHILSYTRLRERER